jgi:DNA-binding response OmpR family regulator
MHTAELPAISVPGPHHLDPVPHPPSAALTPTERRLLAHLTAHAGRVVTRSELLDQVWPLTERPSPALVTIYVRSLRTKLAPDPTAPVIEVVPGVGYQVRRTS